MVNRMMRQLKEKRRLMLKDLKEKEVAERKQERQEEQYMEALLASKKLAEKNKEKEAMKRQLEARK